MSLQDCKKCGKETNIAWVTDDNSSEIQCLNCKQKVNRSTRGAAMTAWNNAQLWPSKELKDTFDRVFGS